MSSKPYTVLMTLTISGDERDVPVRAFVEYGVGFAGCWGGVLDGEITACIDGKWVPLEDLDLDPRDIEHATEALEEACGNDDSGMGREHDDERCCA